MNQNEIVQKKERIATNCVCCECRDLKKSPAILMPFIAHRVWGWVPVEITENWGLLTIKKGMAYSICNSLQCNNCGLIFLDIRFNEHECNALYDGYRGKEYTELREKYEPGYKERNDLLDSGITYLPEIEQFLLPYVKFPVNMLDWGGDTGKNTPFKNKNHIFHIYDVSNKQVILGAVNVDKTTVLNTKYDLIVCSNVLEHVPYPIELLVEIKHSMQKDTLLYVEVPFEEIMRNSDSENNLLTKKRHWHEHINFFSENSLNILLEKCELKIVELKQLKVSVANKICYQFIAICRLK